MDDMHYIQVTPGIWVDESLCVCTGYSVMNWCVLYCTWSAICCGYCRAVCSLAVWLLGVGMWYWKHRVSGYVLGGRRLVVWRVPQSRRWCSLWESWDHYLLRSCRIHSGTLWFHRSPLDCQECMGIVLHVLMLGAMFGRCYSYTTLLSCHRH
jgi:hypothetical protein